MPITDSPCHNNGMDCPKRTVEPNCHATCEEYIIWAELERKRRRARKRAELDVEGFIYEQPKRIIACARQRSAKKNRR